MENPSMRFATGNPKKVNDMYPKMWKPAKLDVSGSKIPENKFNNINTLNKHAAHP